VVSSTDTGEPLDVAIVTTQYPAASETFVTARLKTLHALGHRLHIYTMRPRHKDHQKLLDERELHALVADQNSVGASLRGVLQALARPVLLFDTLRWLWRRTSDRPEHLRFSLLILPRSFDILAKLEQEPPAVLHLEWGHFPSVTAHLVQQRLPEVIVSTSLIAYDLTTEYGGTIDVTRAADVIRTQAAINVPQIAGFTGVGPERIAVIYDGVDMARIDDLNAASQKVPGRVVCAARLVPDKGVDDAIRVFAAARRAAPDATLHVLGDGPEAERLKRLATELGVMDTVEFMGLVSHDQVLRELGGAEVLLHLSLKERLPNVVKEAMACACLAITTRTVGIEELVTDGQTGFVVEHGDLATPTALLSKALSAELPLRQITEAARHFIADNFDHQANVEKLVSSWRATIPTVRLDEANAVGVARSG